LDKKDQQANNKETRNNNSDEIYLSPQDKELQKMIKQNPNYSDRNTALAQG
jgi:hypothetical protein